MKASDRSEYWIDECEKLQSQLAAAQTELFALRAAAEQRQNEFAKGCNSMSRSVLAAIQLVRRNQWTLDDVERWLNACLKNDAQYVEKAVAEIAAKMKGANE